MKGLAAVSLAGNIIQFVHSTRKLLAASGEIFDSRTKAGHLELEAISTDWRNRADAISVPRLTQIDPNRRTEVLKEQDQIEKLLQAPRIVWRDSEIETLREILNESGGQSTPR